ncbi:uncharacterized protein LY89DRAFT_579832 [Mollisia scopiformis]|uniref:Sterol regulatory element-binding protein cleavage-activating protein n=1 Tax=Mollisia scopiformis TaxID=149040 RepID=A0A194XHW5_MOLSC|nr:uncharacterized protein LY89DRAFT_579832 [Mollisia scopiformis]KUJ19726.1 hypothetical protein LY89DRAFT_579832 [Mollisia scopiformis]
MRSVWIHGSYMKALEQDVLRSALEVQDELLGPTVDFAPKRPSNQLEAYDPFTDLSIDDRDTLHAINGLTNLSWFYHSPLQYWSSSLEKIASDEDIISTVNAKSNQSTSVNVTLRHSIVFSGKRFEDHRLVAADALVITLIHMLDSPVGRQWERKAEQLALRHGGKWQTFPAEGRSLISTLYEFRFQPLSLNDDVWLASVYSLMAVYVIFNITRFAALKSRAGLLLAVATQMAVSIMSSFTVCAVWKIDLSHMPRAAYPLVIMGIGLGNIFNLINAVNLTPPSAPKDVRIGEALGQTGHIALTSLALNASLLYMTYKLCENFPPIVALCAFAGIAILFDFFYLLTFFTPVLSVDIRRTELSDALSRASTRNGTSFTPVSQPRKTWFGPFFDGNASTRIAGPIVMVGSILMAQLHYESWSQTILRLFMIWTSYAQTARPAAVSHLSVDINQARTPTAWLQMQDHETAHEVIQVVKPHATSYIARVYDPLIFVLEGSNRTRNDQGIRRFLPAAYDFARNQFTAFVLSVTIIVAAVCLLMNHLLSNEPSENDSEKREDDPLLSVKTLSGGHSLDIMLLATSRDGVLATVGLDRWIRIWDVRKGVMSYIVRDFESSIDPFPVLAVAIDRDSNWLAILSGKDLVFLWNIPERRWGRSMHVEMKGRTPLTFCFGHDKDEFVDPVVVVRHNGLMTELHVDDEYSRQIQICRSPLVCVRPHFEKPHTGSPDPPPRLITSSRKGCVHIASQLEEGWVSNELKVPEPEDDKEVVSIVPLPVLSCFLAVRKHSVDLIDIGTLNVTHTFTTSPMKPDSLRCFHSTRRRPQCGSVGLASLAIAYTCAETGNVILQSYLPQREGDIICFRDPFTPGSKTCCLWRETVENKYVVENPGQWEALQVGYLVGIRKCESIIKEMSHPIANTGVRRRGARPNRPSLERRNSEDEAWEVWSISSAGARATTPLFGSKDRDHLLVSSLGPLQKMGKSSLAVALGNIVKIITVGHENFDSADSSNDDSAFLGTASSVGRRKKLLGNRKKTL